MDKQAKMKILAKQFGDMSKNKDMKAFFPDKANPFIWHVSYKGPQDSSFQGGVYHCEINLTNYPEKPVTLKLLHENGSYQNNESLCIVGLTEMGGSWTPGTSVETIISSLSILMSVPEGRHGVGYIVKTNEEDIKRHNISSQTYKCSVCGADHSTMFK
ncbi:Ubiquitin-conjugating_enzyme E2 [Hexamita inflata]|uniref:Ubiquitin-conjugating enzyme E2 n=1 Tax=Hexamita inflata TaxID=28002 RepID=A0AA86UWH5_9EUKA|nr:Ubiquitin-conjugating enzyme E2 [Hexamita inflata]